MFLGSSSALVHWLPMPRIDGINLRRTRISLVKHALFGKDSFRFGTMLGLWFSRLPIGGLLTRVTIPGSFVAIYRFLLNAFPLLFPANVPMSLNLRNLLLSSSKRRAARWHSIVAGAVAGGIAISLENPSRRKVIAQQLFVRQVPLLCNWSYS
jgi:hypothetical protein